MRTLVWRYALAPIGVAVAMLLHFSPAGFAFSPAGLCVLAVLVSAWFGGPGPGFVAALLGTFLLPQIDPASHPLLGGFFDLRRFLVFSAVGIVGGWWSFRRRQVEAALRKSEERLALAVAGSHDGVWDIDFVARSVTCSARTRELSGLPPGPELTSLDGWVEALPLHPDDRPRRDAAVQAHLSGKAPVYEGEFRVRQLDGAYRWRRLHGVCIRDANGKPLRMAGSISDVDARRRAEDALRESEERYELAMNASDVGFWDWIAAGDKVYISRRLREICGFAADMNLSGRDELVARIPFHQEDRPQWERAVAAHFAGSEAHFKMEARLVVGGHIRWTAFRFLLTRDARGDPVRWTGSVGDITERRLAEEGLVVMERKMRLSQRLEALGTLAGGIAHDFNNILGAILGYGEMALRGVPSGSRVAKDIESVMIAGERGRALVDRVLSFSRSAVGDRGPVNVERVVREAVGLLRANLPEGVTIDVRLDAGDAAMIGEPTQVHQVVANLVMNAVQALPSGGTVHVSLGIRRFDALHVATNGTVAAGDYIVLDVSDSGIGIPPEIVDRIFEPFFTTKEVNVGTGLGLSLVHGVVSEVGGAIDVSSVRGAGSRFTVYLPRTGDAPGSTRPDDAALSPKGRGQRVLVVDDEEPLVRLTIERLKDLGYQPVGFTSPMEALAAFGGDPHAFDAVITDERMPGVSGSALIRRMRLVRPTLPMLLVSGFPDVSSRSDAGDHGADDVLRKPLSETDLATSLARVLRR